MGEQKYQPGTMWTDVANRLQYQAFPDGSDAMISRLMPGLMRGIVRTMLAASCMVALGACSEDPAMPQDESFAACLERAGLSMPSEDASGKEVSRVMQDPQALGCAVDELHTDALRTWMRAGFEETETGPLLDTLKKYVESSDRGGLKLAQETGTLVGVMDQEAEAWNPMVYEPVMAWEIHKATAGEPPGFAAWAERNPSRTGAEAIVVYLGELGGSPNGSEKNKAWIEINELQAEVMKARRAAAE